MAITALALIVGLIALPAVGDGAESALAWAIITAALDPAKVQDKV